MRSPTFALTALASIANFAFAAPSSSSTNVLYARSNAIGNGIEAHFEFWGTTDGTGTFVKVDVIKGLFENSSTFQGPFLYHVHTNAVGEERNCTKALAHLDPLGVTESLICDPAFPQYCQEGDLSGKHGTLNGTASGTVDAFGYTDDYLRFFPEDLSILGRSVVVHSSNKTRLACGDIISTLDGTASSSYKPTGKASTFVKNYPQVAPPNPPQVVTPFTGTAFPDNSTLNNLPFPLPNPAISLHDALNVALTMQNQTVFVNGTQTQAVLPVEAEASGGSPFKSSSGVKSWPWSA